MMCVNTVGMPNLLYTCSTNLLCLSSLLTVLNLVCHLVYFSNSRSVLFNRSYSIKIVVVQKLVKDTTFILSKSFLINADTAEFLMQQEKCVDRQMTFQLHIRSRFVTHRCYCSMCISIYTFINVYGSFT